LITEDVGKGRHIYRAAEDVFRLFNLLMFSNHRGAVRVEPDDRRFFMLRALAFHQGDAAYWEALHHEIDQPEFYPELLWFFLHRDLSHFQDVPPMTHFKQEQILEHKPTHLQFIDEREWRPSEVKFGVHMNDCLWRELQDFYQENRTPEQYRITKGKFRAELVGHVRIVQPANGHETITYFPLEGAKLIGEDPEEFMEPAE
jgi:hypothetical protein